MEPGCWPDKAGDLSDAAACIRLAVSVPGEVLDSDAVPRGSRRYPACNLATRREGDGISILIAHDSYLRFTLSSWKGEARDVRFPFAAGVRSVRAFIFKRFTPGALDSFTAEEIPDVIIEQFPECRLDGSAHKYLDASTRAAALFGRAAEPEQGREPSSDGRIVARAVLEEIRPVGKGKPAILLKCGERELGRRGITPGVRRAVFFDAVEAPAGELAVELVSCTAAKTNLSWRLAAP